MKDGLLVRLVRDSRVRNVVAFLAAVASLVGFVGARLEAHLSGEGGQSFLLRWWAEIVFIPAAIIVLAYLLAVVRTRFPLAVSYHRFLTVSVPDEESVPVDHTMLVRIASRAEHFRIDVTGEIYGPDLHEVMKRFNAEVHEAGVDVEVPVQMLVTEITSGARDLWWPQDRGEFRSDGTYSSPAYLGGTGPNSAFDGQIFELRVLIPGTWNGWLKHHDQKRALDDLPKHAFLSEALFVQTKR